MSRNYTVSKKQFFRDTVSLGCQLHGISRFVSPSRHSHRYGIQTQRIKRGQDPLKLLEVYLLQEKQSWIDIQDWFPLDVNPIKLNSISSEIRPCHESDPQHFACVHLCRGLSHLPLSAEAFQQVLLSTYQGIAWTIADQLMFMSDNFKVDWPCWQMSISAPKRQQHLLCIQMKFAMVMMFFDYPTPNLERIKHARFPQSNSPFEKSLFNASRSVDLLLATDLIYPYTA